MPKRANGEGSLRRRGSGWEARLVLGYQPDGRPIRKSLYGSTRAEAQQKLTRALNDLRQGIMPVDERQTVGQFLDRWLEASVKPNLRHSSYLRSEQVVRLHLKPHLGRIRLNKISPQDVQSLLNRKQKEGLSARSVQIIHATLRAALNQALRWGIVNRNVAQLVRPPRAAQREVRPLTPDEARGFLGAAAGDPLEALFLLALSSGLRKGEVLGLRWRDVDLDKGTISVRYALHRIEGEYVLTEPKTAQSRRTIFIPAVAVTGLKAHRARQAAERLAAGPEWNEWGGLVFTTDRGQPLNGCVVSHRFKDILEQAGLHTLRFHDLRHTCATLLLSQGVNPKLVQEHLGHSEIGTTLNVYSHVLAEQRGETARQMDMLLSG